METGSTDGHKHHVRDLSVFDCSRCPACGLLYFTGGDDPASTCSVCDAALEEVRLDCQPRLDKLGLAEDDQA